MSVNTFFDHIYCLNLDRRPDRWERCQEIFEQYDVKDVERFSASDGEVMEHYPNLTWGQVGVIDSHRRILTDAKEKRYRNILIFEDDVEFEPNFLEVFEKIEAECPSWMMLYLGWNDELAGTTGRVRVTDHLIYASSFLAIHALGIDSLLFDIILNQMHYDVPLDIMYLRFNGGNHCFAANPRIAYQRPDWSDINSHYVNYEHKLREI